MKPHVSRPRRAIFPKIGFGALMILGASVFTSIPASAVGGAFLEIDDIPDRGYYLAGDYLEYSYSCGDNASLVLDAPDLNFTSGIAGGGYFRMELDFINAPGTYEITLTCTDVDTGEEEIESFSFELRESLELTASVGTVPGECATTREITVPVGTEVFWCYTLSVVPEVNFEAEDPEDQITVHSISDSISADPIADFTTPNLESSTIIATVTQGIERSTIATETITNDVSWSATRIDIEDDFSYAPSVLFAQAIVRVTDAPELDLDPDPESKTPTPRASDDDQKRDSNESNDGAGSGQASVSKPSEESAAIAVRGQPRVTG